MHWHIKLTTQCIFPLKNEQFSILNYRYFIIYGYFIVGFKMQPFVVAVDVLIPRTSRIIGLRPFQSILYRYILNIWQLIRDTLNYRFIFITRYTNWVNYMPIQVLFMQIELMRCVCWYIQYHWHPTIEIGLVGRHRHGNRSGIVERGDMKKRQMTISTWSCSITAPVIPIHLGHGEPELGIELGKGWGGQQ